MIELPLTFMAGLLGSAHCVGMCGPLAVAVGSQTASVPSNLQRQIVYSAGRIFTYATLGAVAGYGGHRLAESVPPLVNIPALLALGAGLLLTWQGLRATGLLSGVATSASVPCLASTFFASLFTAPGWQGVFLAGLFTGLLPCGLLYGLLALAATAGTVEGGMLVMVTFGLGTVPVMAATGCGGSLLSLASRRHVYRLAGLAVMVAGILSIARGIGYVHIPGRTEAAGCPFCAEQAE